MANLEINIKKKDFQKMAQTIQDFQSKILNDVDATRLRDAFNMALLQMQTYWKVLKKKQDKKIDKYSWPWYDLKNPQNNLPQYLASSLYGAGVHKEKLPQLFDLLSSGHAQKCEQYIQTHGYNGEVDALGRTPLHYCAGVLKLQHCSALFVQHGCNINHQAHDGSTALHRSVINENLIVTKDLLQHNADTTIRDMEGRTVVHWAVISEHVECLDVLIKHGADLKIPDEERHTPIMWSVMMGKIESLKLLLASPIGPKLARTSDDRGQTLLHMGVNHPDIVILLLNTETVEEKDKYERNILHHASMSGRLDVCRILADNIEIKSLLWPDSDGKTPVHHAVNNAHSSVANFLLEKGGSVNSKDIQGLSAVDIAQLKQLHYCNIVLSAYQQEDEERPAAPPPKVRPGSSRGQRPVSHIKPPTDSRDSHPNDRRVVIKNTSVTGVATKSSPALRINPPTNLSSITPGLLRHSSHQQVSQKVSRLREIPIENREICSGIREQITGGMDREHGAPPLFPPRPTSSHGNRAKGLRPSSPVPQLRDMHENLNTLNEEKDPCPIPWKLNNLKPKPPPKSKLNNEIVQNGDVSQHPEPDTIPSRPKTARGNHSDQGMISQRYSKVDPIPARKTDVFVLDNTQTLETVHSLHDTKNKVPIMRPLSPRHSASSLLGAMPALPGQQSTQPPTSQPWYKRKLQPVIPVHKMDVLQPEEPVEQTSPG